MVDLNVIQRELKVEECDARPNVPFGTGGQQKLNRKTNAGNTISTTNKDLSETNDTGLSLPFAPPL